jgi:heptosyltransferase-2
MMVDPPEKILIIRLSSIGDILLTSPFVRQVRKQFPDARLDYLIKEQFYDLMRFNPHISHLYTLTVPNRDAEKKLKKEFKQTGYQIIFDLHNNLRSNFFKRGIGAAALQSINKNKLKQQLLVLFKINCYRSIQSIPERYLKVAEEYHVQDDGLGLEIYWQKDQEATAAKKIREAGMPTVAQYVCMAPGAAHYTKRWPIDYFSTLSEKIIRQDLKVVLLGGEDDKEWGRLLAKKAEIFDLTGKLNLLETAVILSRARAAVTNDSGLMHMATAVNIPVIAIFGSTVREFGFFPYRGESLVIENKQLSCRPCTHIGRNNCPKRHFKCMIEIKSDDVYHALNQLISSQN